MEKENCSHNPPMKKKHFALIVATLTFSVVYFSCNETNPAKDTSITTGTDTINLLLKGKSIATETQKLLAKNLTDAITSGGTVYAIGFCNLNARSLTDSMSIQLKASVKRVSDNPRNIANKANDTEMAYIQSMKKAIEKGEMANPQILTHENEAIGYYPIFTNSMCLQCHGNKNADITSETQVKIASLYPNDQATGYSINQLRGLWVVTMKSASKN